MIDWHKPPPSFPPPPLTKENSSSPVSLHLMSVAVATFSLTCWSLDWFNRRTTRNLDRPGIDQDKPVTGQCSRSLITDPVSRLVGGRGGALKDPSVIRQDGKTAPKRVALTLYRSHLTFPSFLLVEYMVHGGTVRLSQEDLLSSVFSSGSEVIDNKILKNLSVEVQTRKCTSWSV